MRYVALVAGLLLIATPSATAAPAAELPNGVKKKIQKVTRAPKVSRCPYARMGVTYYRTGYVRWQLKMDRSIPEWRKPRNCADARYLSVLWAHRAREARQAFIRWKAAEEKREFRALYEKWRCIHEHEGAWDSNTGNGYYGGLQMDMGFQGTYGPEFIKRWGTADRWPVWAQLTAAERAYHGYAGYGGRGFGPWPNTSRMCGLR